MPSHGLEHLTTRTAGKPSLCIDAPAHSPAAHHARRLEASGFSRAVAVAQHGPHRRHAGGAAEHIGHAHEQRPMLRHGDASHVQEGIGQQRAPSCSAGTGGEVERLGGLWGGGERGAGGPCKGLVGGLVRSEWRAADYAIAHRSMPQVQQPQQSTWQGSEALHSRWAARAPTACTA